MSTQTSTTLPRRTGTRYAVRHNDWHIHLAAVGEAFVVPVPSATTTEVTVREGNPVAPVAEAAEAAEATSAVDAPWTQLRLGAFGSVTAHTHHAPPALLVDITGDAVQVTSCGSSESARIAVGGLVFACSPSVLQALGPGEIVALPQLLRGAPDLSALLGRWVDTAIQAGSAGAAATIARYQPSPRRTEIIVPDLLDGTGRYRST